MLLVNEVISTYAIPESFFPTVVYSAMCFTVVVYWPRARYGMCPKITLFITCDGCDDIDFNESEEDSFTCTGVQILSHLQIIILPFKIQI